MYHQVHAVIISNEHLKINLQILEKYLKKELIRFKKICYYYNNRNSARSEKRKTYFEEYMKIYMHSNESIEGFEQLYEEIYATYILRKAEVKDLAKEIKVIKRLQIL